MCGTEREYGWVAKAVCVSCKEKVLRLWRGEDAETKNTIQSVHYESMRLARKIQQ